MQTTSEIRNNTIEAIGYINLFRNKVFVIKIDGSVISATERMEVLHDIKVLAECGIKIIIVHGGKPDIEKALKDKGIESEIYNGERVTTAESLEIIKELYIEKISPKLARALKELGVAISGRNMNFLKCKKKKEAGGKLGFVGEIRSVDTTLIDNLLAAGCVPIVSPLGIDENGDTCNICPEHVALQIAREIKAEKLIFLTKKDGIIDSNGNIIHEIDIEKALEIKAERSISESMYSKIDAGARALSFGIKSVHILNGTKPHQLFDEIVSHAGVGTMFMNVCEAERRRVIIDKLKSEEC